jgi:hypothetical protein
MTQKEAVYNAITTVFADNGVTFPPGFNAASLLTKSLRKAVMNQLVSDFQNGLITLSADANTKLSNAVELRAYVSGLISNWLRKDVRLSGGAVTKTTVRASSVQSTDPQLKVLNTLLKAQTDPVKIAEVQAAIAAYKTVV